MKAVEMVVSRVILAGINDTMGWPVPCHIASHDERGRRGEDNTVKQVGLQVLTKGPGAWLAQVNSGGLLYWCHCVTLIFLKLIGRDGSSSKSSSEIFTPPMLTVTFGLFPPPILALSTIIPAISASAI